MPLGGYLRSRSGAFIFLSSVDLLMSADIDKICDIFVNIVDDSNVADYRERSMTVKFSAKLMVF